LKEQWCIPPQSNAEFVAAMEDVLEVYCRPHDPKRPVVCLDETFKQLIGETREALLARPGAVERFDHVYTRNGVASLFLACLDTGPLSLMALPAFRRAELEYLVTFSGAKAIAFAPEYRGFDHASLARELKQICGGLELLFSTESASEFSGAIQRRSRTSKTSGRALRQRAAWMPLSLTFSMPAPCAMRSFMLVRRSSSIS